MRRDIWQLQVKAFSLQETPYSCSNGVECSWDGAVAPYFSAQRISAL